MELKETIEIRRSIRKYKDDEISEETLKEAIKYGIMAPSAHNRQPWRVKILTKEEKNKIADMLYQKTKDIKGHTGPHTAGLIKDTPNAILVFMDNKSDEERDLDIISIGAFIENIILYLTNLDLGTLWIGNTNLVKEEINNFLKTNYEPISMVLVGKKDQDPHARPRKDLEEIII